MNERKKVLFLSHAAADGEIASYFKKILEETFVDVKVFVTSDPEDLPPGDAWVQTVLENLREAMLVLILATERGLSRKWVWFEAGAGWGRPVTFVPCCLGKIRKGDLPSPYSHYQAMNLDERKDLEAIFAAVAVAFSSTALAVDYAALLDVLVRLDVRAEERSKVRLSPFSAELSSRVLEGMKKLGNHETEALKQLLIEGELDDKRAITLVQEKGLLHGAMVFIFPAIQQKTGFVQRCWESSHDERVRGYTGPWRINPALLSDIETYFVRSAPTG